ncbi:DUF4358 domain-containing protein [Inconstantimicrobium mannanitabidum]|uniref:Uncharacterized protein n=1 Tax=Inconstantimicrobium mannanitabidum TaxID=1604901 RepID=A0ACB5R6Z5_9CLOT|nr:DUF4358 domain-containing protein [Clostridium sp. TW13]GKX64802.1 hypothetical protein rsdtw13_00600 [Clostridium sp. TW13]
MKKSYKIKYYILGMSVIIIFIALYGVIKQKDVSISQINASVVSNTDVKVMDKGDSSKLRKLYYINKSEVEDFVLYAPKNNMESNEILIIKAKSKGDMKDLKSKIQKRIDKQSDSFKSYRPEEYKIISKHVLEEKNQYIILIISKDVQKIEESVNKIF